MINLPNLILNSVMLSRAPQKCMYLVILCSSDRSSESRYVLKLSCNRSLQMGLCWTLLCSSCCGFIDRHLLQSAYWVALPPADGHIRAQMCCDLCEVIPKQVSLPLGTLKR